MTIPMSQPATDEVQLVRAILAELAETGAGVLSRERHLDVLLALDNVELAAHHPWPPPPASEGIDDVGLALTLAWEALVAVLADLKAHDVEPVRIALAHDHLSRALTRVS